MENLKKYAPVDIFAFDFDGEKSYSVQIIVGSEGLEKAESLFEKHDNYPNGYGWEGLITYFLTEEHPDLLELIEFDCEAGAFVAVVDSEETMLRLAGVLQAFILDLSKLAGYLAVLPEAFRDA
jgi:hypothetical protein